MPLEPGNMPNLEEILLEAYTHLIGGYFWAFILMLMVAGVYLRTRNFGPTYLVLMIGALILRTAMPTGPMDVLLFVSIISGIAYSGFKVFVE